ncbi:MAG: TonB-dependent receptor [Fidelibacterota bacterium]|nr:MAG: TonB-dependent receptor [Candidatus Neomarinimicrobiota bacterium]
MKTTTCLFFAIPLFAAVLQGQIVGSLAGQITDIDTHQPLVGANVILEGTTLGAAADAQGKFRIVNIPVGSYTVRVMMMGYKAQARANVHVVPQRETILNIALEPTVLEVEGVTVTAGFFERAKDAMVSTRTVNIEEIRSDPVGAYDILRMMQALPSVSSDADQTNEIIIRGGHPGENLFIMDHLEIPYPNHFSNQGLGGGPVTTVNTAFIDRIDFYAGAFSARYGDKLSSVMDVTLREGRRSRHLAEFNLNMSGAGLLVEGPITDKGSYLAALNRSFLDLVIRQTGLMAVPQYWTAQAKVAYDLDHRRKLLFNFLGGIDAIVIEEEGTPQTRGAENVDFGSNQYTLGLTYKDLFSQNGHFLLSLGQSRTRFDVDVYKILANSERNDYFNKDDVEIETTLKGDWFYKLNPSLELGSGFNLKHVVLDYLDSYAGEPLVLYGYAPDSLTMPEVVSREYFNDHIFHNPRAVVVPFDTLLDGNPWSRTYQPSFLKIGFYGQVRWQPQARLALILGGRIEHMEFTGAANFSPRLSISYSLTDKLKLNASAGRYYQSPYYDQLFSGGVKTDSLKNFYADQGVLGLEYLLREDVRATLEIYGKTYDDMVIPHASTTRDTSDDFGSWVNAGAGHSYGVEFFIQKKFSSHWYGTLSYSKSVAEGIDPRYPGEDKTYPWDYDFGDVMSLIGGYKIRYMDYDWYRRMKDKFWFGMFSWLPFWPADEFEASFRARYVGGRPYTPRIYNHNVRRWYTYGDQEWNTERFGHYFRFDIMLLQRFYFKKMNLVAFWDIMNVFNRDNPWDWQYYEDGTREMVLQFKTFPIGGVTLEF